MVQCRDEGFTPSGGRYVCLSDAHRGRQRCGFCQAHCECRPRQPAADAEYSAQCSSWRAEESTGDGAIETRASADAWEGPERKAHGEESEAPSVDGLAASLTDWAVEEGFREQVSLCPSTAEYVEPTSVWLVSGEEEVSRAESRTGCVGALSAEGLRSQAMLMLHRSWRGRDVGFCSFGGRTVERDRTADPLIGMTSDGIVATIHGRKRSIHALSDMFWLPWSQLPGKERMSAASEVREALGELFAAFSTGACRLVLPGEERGRNSILADVPVPFYPEYCSVQKMVRSKVSPALWWRDQCPITGEEWGPSWVVSELLVPADWHRADIGRGPPAAHSTWYTSRSDLKAGSPDPWEAKVVDTTGLPCPVVVRSAEMGREESPTVVIDWWVVAGSKAAERGFLAVGHDPGTALVSGGGNVSQFGGARRICLRDSRPVMLPTIADCKEADDAVAELASTPGPVDPRACGTEGWLDGREVVCALNDDTFLLLARSGTGCYLGLRGRKTALHGEINFAPLDWREVVPLVASVEEGELVEQCSGLTLEVEEGYIAIKDCVARFGTVGAARGPAGGQRGRLAMLQCVHSVKHKSLD